MFHIPTLFLIILFVVGFVLVLAGAYAHNYQNDESKAKLLYAIGGTFMALAPVVAFVQALVVTPRSAVHPVHV